MEYVRQTIGSSALKDIFELPESLRDKEVDVIILATEDSVTKKSPRKRQLGFLNLPPIPDSFFEPLPEEELQAWGL
ncbi:MAG: hypothetical protein FWC73_05445 [Defluviitaleaceae bacterium]|nr:hypothetical protein [Defluviitaleaceae bacterium]